MRGCHNAAERTENENTGEWKNDGGQGRLITQATQKSHRG